ncbi:hypothetical protein BpHYR1_052281 [Brachionus plicatilis]|uniref:Uncharacterized protein n=1 Tax=Brachionus plicatilis TaxID=10195 RepID=A0A3M7S3P4_BRAPC|nr:hypothetical protein BpHYR1_052281 [Brachionus plicatilis]
MQLDSIQDKATLVNISYVMSVDEKQNSIIGVSHYQQEKQALACKFLQNLSIILKIDRNLINECWINTTYAMINKKIKSDFDFRTTRAHSFAYAEHNWAKLRHNGATLYKFEIITQNLSKVRNK